MRIYLDTSALQYLKRSSDIKLRELVISMKDSQLFCFSEALLYDFMNDTSPQKLKDLKVMEEIVDDNCFFYDKKISFDYYTPTEYFLKYEWKEVPDLFPLDESTLDMANLLLGNTETNFQEHIDANMLPDDYPESIKKLISSSTMTEVFTAMCSLTDSMLTDKSTFKQQLKYLHKNAEVISTYEFEGFDGKVVTDMEKFKGSYLKKFQERSKNDYDLFTNLYNGLEFYGIVKGKPDKQKMWNMINDGRHAFFGAVCEVVVSADIDFIEKTRFLYNLYDIQTNVISYSELELLLQGEKGNLHDIKLDTAVATSNQLETIDFTEDDGISYLSKRIRSKYLSYFDTLTFADGTKRFICLSKELTNLAKSVLTRELALVTNLLVHELGIDSQEKGDFDYKEADDDKWSGRIWVFERIHIKLICDGKIYLYIVF